MLVDGRRRHRRLRGRRGARPRRPAAGRHRPQRRVPDRRRRHASARSCTSTGPTPTARSSRPGWSGSPAADVPLWRLTAEHKLPVFVEDTPDRATCSTRRLAAGPRPGVLRQRPAAVRRPAARAGRHRLGVRNARTWSPAVREAVRQVTLEGALVVENAALRAVEKLRLAAAGHRGAPRPADRPGQPPPASSRSSRRTVYGVGGRRLRRPHDRPGPLQGDQRQLRPQRRRRPALPGRARGSSRPWRRATCWRAWAATSSPSCCPMPTPTARRRSPTASGPPCATRSCSTACRCTSTPASASRSARTTAATARCCSRAPTPPCTWPSAAGTGSRSGRPTGRPASRDRLETLEQLRDGPGHRPARRPLPAQARPADRRASSASRRSCAGTTPSAGCSTPTSSCPLAEQAGLMRRLALAGAGAVAARPAAWRATGLELSVAVNLSVSNLQDVALPEQVEMLLDAFAVPAEALILEITEDVLMADAARSQQVMAGLRRPRRPAVDRRLRHRLLVAVLPARAARRRAQARPQLRQPPDVGRARRGDRPQHAAAEPATSA